MRPRILTVTRKPGSKPPRPYINLTSILEGSNFQIGDKTVVAASFSDMAISISRIPTKFAADFKALDDNESE